MLNQQQNIQIPAYDMGHFKTPDGYSTSRCVNEGVHNDLFSMTAVPSSTVQVSTTNENTSSKRRRGPKSNVPTRVVDESTGSQTEDFVNNLFKSAQKQSSNGSCSRCSSVYGSEINYQTNTIQYRPPEQFSALNLLSNNRGKANAENIVSEVESMMKQFTETHQMSSDSSLFTRENGYRGAYTPY
jgi:hypothetical protein